MSSERAFREVNRTFRPDEFHDDGGLDARWGSKNSVIGRVDENGRLAGYCLRLAVEDIRVVLDAETDCSGVKFVARSPMADGLSERSRNPEVTHTIAPTRLFDNENERSS